jgi:hypothetical protein
MRERWLVRRLRAMRDPVPPPDLAARLTSGIPGSWGRRESGAAGRAWTMVKIGLSTAVVAAMVWAVIALLPGPAGPGVSLAAVLEPVMNATGAVPAVHVVLRVLSREGEDFDFVDLDAPAPLTYEAWIEMPGDGRPGRARISKGDRVYAFDGTETITWHPPRNEASRTKGCALDLEQFWPAAWVRGIRDSSSAVVREHREERGSGTLVLREPGVGVRGRAPAFLQEFDRETEITWALGTNRLTGLRRWVLQDGRHLVSELVSIDYLPAADPAVFALDLPAGVRWVSLAEAPDELAALGPRDVARRFFQAAIHGDQETMVLLGASPHVAEGIAALGITEVLSLGEPFRTGAYPGMYVPYVVRVGSGAAAALRRHNLAVRNDNAQRRWVFDGGI